MVKWEISASTECVQLGKTAKLPVLINDGIFVVAANACVALLFTNKE